MEPITIAYFRSGLLQDKSYIEQCYKDLVARFQLLPTLQEFCTFAESERILFEASAETDAALPSAQTILKRPNDFSSPQFEKKEPDAAESAAEQKDADLDDVSLPEASPDTKTIGNALKFSTSPIGFADLLTGVRMKWFLQKFGRSALLLFKALFLCVKINTIFHNLP